MNRGHDAWHRMAQARKVAQTAAGMAGYTSRTNTARCVPAAVFNVQTVVFVLVLFG